MFYGSNGGHVDNTVGSGAGYYLLGVSSSIAGNGNPFFYQHVLDFLSLRMVG